MEIEVPQSNGTTNMVLQLAEILQNERGFPPLLSKTFGLVDDPFLPHYLFAEELVHTSIPRWQWDPILEWEKHGIYSESVRGNMFVSIFLFIYLCYLFTFADICMQRVEFLLFFS